MPVDFAAVSRGPMAETLDHEGRTRVRERYVVSAPVAGRVLRIELRPGDRVVANQTVIATFAPGASSLLDARSRAGATSRVSGAEALLEQARAQRELARVQSQHAKEERDRAQNLAKFGLMTTEGLQAAETAGAASAALARRRRGRRACGGARGGGGPRDAGRARNRPQDRRARPRTASR